MRIRKVGSRGKGKRRVPWRDGGARKLKKVVKWNSKATYMLKSCTEIFSPVVSIRIRFNVSPETSIYLFDQKAAKINLQYYAKLIKPIYKRSSKFDIFFTDEKKEFVIEIINEIIDELNSKNI